MKRSTLKNRLIAIILAMLFVLNGASVFAYAEEIAYHTVFSIGDVSGRPDETVELDITVAGDTGVSGLLLHGLTYDKSVFELVGFDSYGTLVTNSVAGTDSISNGIINLGYNPNIVPNGKICSVKFKIKENAAEGNYIIKFSTVASSDNGKAVSSVLENGTITVSKWLRGDFDSNGTVDMQDAVHFIGWVNFSYIPDLYSMPYSGDKDFNHDGNINMQDAVYLIGWINFSYIPGLYDIDWYGTYCPHSMQATPAKAKTCTEDGNTAYWYCTSCEKYFKDSAGKTETTLAETVIPAKNHANSVSDEGTPATTTEKGYTPGVYCNDCKKWISGHDIIPPLSPNESNISYRHYVKRENSTGIIEIVNDEYLSSHEIINPNPAKYVEGIGVSELIEGVEIDGKKVSANGYSFLGWYEKPEASAKRVYSISADAKGDKVLYGLWSKNEYTITFDNSSMNLPSTTKTYTVDQKVPLDKPSVDRYVFLGWTTDDDKLVSEIKPGTTGNFTLHSNWTSKRNLAKPVANLGKPIIIEDTNEGKILFTYEIGQVENVPLYTIKDLPSAGGVVSVYTETVKKGIGKTDASTVAKAIDHVTTDSTAWTLSEDWNETTHVEDSVLNEHGYDRTTGQQIGKTSSNTYTLTTNEYDNTVVKANEGTVATTTQYDTKDVNTRETWEAKAGLSVSDTESSKYTTSAKVSAEVGVSAGGVGAKMGASMESSAEVSSSVTAGVSEETTIAHENTSHTKTGTDKVTVADNTTTTTTDKGWSKTTNSSSSSSSSLTKYEEQVLSEKIAEECKYGESYAKGGSNSASADWSTSTGESTQYSTTLTYFNSEETTEGVSYTINGESDGSYRLVRAGIVHVFAVVIYDIANAQYGVTTYAVLDDKTYTYIDYSATSAAKFNDNENGVLPFEIPYEVNDYINGRIIATEGLDYDEAALSTAEYKGSETSVVIPEFYSMDNKDYTRSAYTIRHLSANTFKGNTTLKSVLLSNYIREIPDSAFKGCSSLQFVYGSEIELIGDYAFDGCGSLGEFKVASTVKSMGEKAFNGVDSIVVEASSKDVVHGAINSGAKRITINISNIADEMSNTTLEIPNTVEYFELQGGRKTFKGLKIHSNAATTVLNGITITEGGAAPLDISSESLTLNQVFVESTSYVLLMKGQAPTISLYGTSRLVSSSNNAMVCRNVTFQKLDSTVGSKLEITGNLLTYGSLDESLIDFPERGKVVPLKSIDEYNKYIKGCFTVTFNANGGTVSETSRVIYAGEEVAVLPTPSLDEFTFLGWFTEDGTQMDEKALAALDEDITLYAHWESDWVLVSTMPEDAQEVGRKWTYDKTTTIESDVDEVEGYTLYDSTYEWGEYGEWSEWSKDVAEKSDFRDVETREIDATYKTQYNYSRYTQYSNGGGWNGPEKGYWNGIYCEYKVESGWSDTRKPKYDYDYNNGVKFDIFGKSGDSWYNEKTRKVETSPAYTEYRFRDRTQIFTYYLSKTEQLESETEIVSGEGINNIQVWVKYIVK